MKIEKILNALDNIELLLIFKPDHISLSSSQIRLHFKDRVKPHTVDMRVNSLFNQELLEKLYKKDIGKNIKPGGDRYEYRLTKKGIKNRKKIIISAMKLLQKEVHEIIPSVDDKLNSRDKQNIANEISINVSLDLIEVLQDFFNIIISNKEEFSKKLPKEAFRRIIEKIQSIYQHEILDNI